jgi:hypothetical protein
VSDYNPGKAFNAWLYDRLGLATVPGAIAFQFPCPGTDSGVKDTKFNRTSTERVSTMARSWLLVNAAGQAGRLVVLTNTVASAKGGDKIHWPYYPG